MSHDIILGMPKEGMIFYGARHGETKMNAAGIIQGHMNEPLSANGLGQAHDLGRELRSRKSELGIDVIYSSDLVRAYITADVVSYYLGVPVIQDPRLRERSYGEFEGKSFGEVAGEFGVSDLDSSNPRGGEALSEFEARIQTAMLDILSNNPDSTMLFVTHGGVLRAKLKHFKNDEYPDGIGHEIKNAALLEFYVDPSLLNLGDKSVNRGNN